MIQHHTAKDDSEPRQAGTKAPALQCAKMVLNLMVRGTGPLRMYTALPWAPKTSQIQTSDRRPRALLPAPRHTPRLPSTFLQALHSPVLCSPCLELSDCPIYRTSNGACEAGIGDRVGCLSHSVCPWEILTENKYQCGASWSSVLQQPGLISPGSLGFL